MRSSCLQPHLGHQVLVKLEHNPAYWLASVRDIKEHDRVIRVPLGKWHGV
jgi:hypothetical protein